MAVILRNMQRSLNNLRYNLSGIKQKLLLKRIDGNDGTPYFSALSPKNFSPTKQNYYLPQFKDFRAVVGSCNGLICLDNSLDSFLLWNPSTEESRVITSNRCSGLGPDYHKQHSFSSAFGCDSDSEHFKLLRFVYFFEQSEIDSPYRLDHQVIELYDMNSHSWRYIDPLPGQFVLRNPSCYADNCKYWSAYYGETPCIVSFDFASEELCAHELPPNVGRHFDFVVFKGDIGVAMLGSENSFQLWFYNGVSWIREYEIRVPGAQRPLGFWDNSYTLLFEGMDGHIMACDINTGNTTSVKLDGYDPASFGKMELLHYVESDVSIRGLLGSSPVNMDQSRVDDIHKALW